MSATAESLIPSLIRWGSKNGKSALETLATGQWDSLISQNGRQLISSSVNGASFTYSFAPGVDVGTIIMAADEAYKRTLAMTAAGTLTDYLTTPLVKRTGVSF
jgi:hypothetical protein